MLRLEGKLLEPWTDELVRACEQMAPGRRKLRLDLSALTFVDAAGVRLLTELIHDGTMIVACSGYVAAILQMEKR
jgi:ABC-type transporter Mla MlaB component